MTRPAIALLLLLLCTRASGAPSTLTRDAFEAWLADDQVVGISLEPGDVVGPDALDGLGAVLPPGYIDQLRFPEMRLAIQQSGDYSPHAVYREASTAHDGAATLGPDGAIAGDFVGLPFLPARIAAAAPREAGVMVAWNNVFRWTYYGYRSKPLTMYYVRTGGGAGGGERPPGIGGAAAIERSVAMWFHRVYLNHLAMLPETDYTLGVSGSEQTHYKDFMEITAPFDVAGAKFIIERSLDPYEDDQVNSYLPTERRVRRLSAQERADTFMGSEYTFDDFEGFSGRVMDYEWRLAGEKTILAVADSMHERVHVFGPDSHVPDDRWQLRDCYVVEMVPRWDGHPYGAKYVFVDRQSWVVHLALVFDREGGHWKTIDPIWRYPEREQLATSPSASVARWHATIGSDFQRGTATVSQAESTELPAMKPSSVRRLFDVSALNEGR